MSRILQMLKKLKAQERPIEEQLDLPTLGSPSSRSQRETRRRLETLRRPCTDDKELQ